MRIGYVGPKHLESFSSLLLPHIAQAAKNGEPICIIGAAKDNVACGAAAGYMSDGVFKLASLYVAPDYRRRGCGRMMMEGLFELLEAAPVEISFAVTEKEHEELHDFLYAMGFSKVDDEGQTILVTTVGDIARAPFFNQTAKTSDSVKFFEELSRFQISEAQRDAVFNDVPIPEGGLLGSGIDKSLSCAILEGSKVRAFVIFDRSFCNELTLASAWSNSSPTALPMMLLAAENRLAKCYLPETKLVMQAVNSTSAKLVKKLVPEAKSISFTYLYVEKDDSQF